jgi:CRISPR-associated protein Cas6
MYWQEEIKTKDVGVSDEVVDLVFSLHCKCLPVNHLSALSAALVNELPWLLDEPSSGLHPVNIASSGNGWVQTDDPQALLYLSQRTSFALRVPKHRINDALQLEGKSLDVSGYAFTIKKASERRLSKITTLYSRFLVVPDGNEDEQKMLAWVSQQLAKLAITPKKMLCGKTVFIETPDKKILTRSLMIADLEVEESLRLQQYGLGSYRYLACGLFIPHKDINDIRKEKD